MKTISWVLIPMVLCGPIRADFSNNQAASSVIGKPDFFSTTPTTASAEILGLPSDVAVDPTTGKVFVSDQSHNRVLRFSSTSAYQSGATAEGVLGQVSFGGSSANQGGAVGAGTMKNPVGMAFDAAGRLWVADSGNHRVLRFDGASGKADGAAADGVLGQVDFITNGPATSETGMNTPGAVFIDGTGNLWVADVVNHRVLRFSAAADRANGAAANQVLGQSTFTTAASALGSGGMGNPIGLFVDAQLRLWVVCNSQHRVLRFDNAAAKGNGGNAEGVLGQVDFNSSSSTPVTAASLYFPLGCLVSADGTLWVSDASNHRILGYRGAAGKSSGANADRVLGQPSFDTKDVFPVNSRSLLAPFGMATGRDGVLLVADLDVGRMLRFSPAVEIKALARVTARNGRATIRGTSKFASLVTYKGPKAPYRRAAGPAAKWTVKLSRLGRPTTRVPVKASAFDGRSAQKTVVVRSRR